MCRFCKKQALAIYQKRFRAKKKLENGKRGNCQSCDMGCTLKYHNGMLMCRECIRVYVKRNHKRNSDKNRRTIEEIKSKSPCIDCGGIFHSCAMDFDHLDSSQKIASIAYLMHQGSEEMILSEIKKCELVCANCHRVRTWKRYHGK